MKPENTVVARKQDYSIRGIKVSEAKPIVAEYHYAKGGSNTAIYLHGLFRNDTGELVGLAWWLQPTMRTCKRVLEDWQKVIGLSRLVVMPNEPQNAASILLGKSMKLIKQDGRYNALVTFADCAQGHSGIIYRATNWEYAGLSRANRSWVDPKTKRQVACKATRNRTKAEMLSLGYVQTEAFPKHRYVFNFR